MFMHVIRPRPRHLFSGLWMVNDTIFYSIISTDIAFLLSKSSPTSEGCSHSQEHRMQFCQLWPDPLAILSFRSKHNIWEYFHYWVEEWILEVMESGKFDDRSSFITSNETDLCEVTIWPQCCGTNVSLPRTLSHRANGNHEEYYRVNGHRT
jgi:hypothetical protein